MSCYGSWREACEPDCPGEAHKPRPALKAADAGRGYNFTREEVEKAMEARYGRLNKLFDEIFSARSRRIA